MFGLNPMELMIVGAVAVLLFGSKLPSVARSMGQSMMQFKRGMHELHDEVNYAGAGSRATPKVKHYHEIDDRDESTAPKFEPPKFEPPSAEPSAAEPSTAEPTAG